MKQIYLFKRLFASFVLLLMTTLSWAYDFEVNGIYYDRNSDGTSVTVTNGTPGYFGSVTIPATVTYSAQTYDVTSIGNYAFKDCSGLTSITIPNSVTSIGWQAFSGCSGLTSVTIPNSVTSIGEYAFSGCTSLPVIDDIRYADTYLVGAVDKTLSTYSIKAGTRFIGEQAFYNCKGLTSITIPNSVTSIGNYAFRDCSGLTSINIPNNVTSIGDEAFYGCSGLKSVTIPNSVTSIGTYAFRNCSGLTSVTIPNGVTSIGYAAFDGCSGLTSITIPNSVTSIGDWAFDGCSGLTSVTIGNGVTSIGTYAFRNCSGLTSVTIPNGVTSIGYAAFDGCSGLTSITIPNSVTSIGDWAFDGCSGLTSITIPNSVTSIGGGAFRGCSGLTSVTCLAEEVPSTGNNVFYNVPQSTATLYVPAGSVDAYEAAAQWKEFGQILPIEDGPTIIDFADAKVKQLCVANWDTNDDGELNEDEAAAVTDLGSVFKNKTTITSFDELQYFTGLTKISDNAFRSCSNLTTVRIPSSVTSIGGSAFESCSGLTSINIPDGVTSIGYGAFSRCSSLTSVTVASGNTKYDSRNNCNAIIETSSNTLVSGCKNTVIPNSVTSIGSYAFEGCSGLTSVTIGNGVTSIGWSAFGGCSGLTSITIPNSVTSIAYGAFYGCSGLTSINIPNSVTSIGDHAFEGCSGLTSITVASGNTKYDSRNNCNAIIETATNTLVVGCKETVIPNTVTSIGGNAFYNCSSLTSINIPNSVTSIGNYAFDGCSSLTSINIPDGVTSIGNYAFDGCSGLTSVTIPNSVTSIGEGAFNGCSGLTSVTIPNSVTSIGNMAFSDCSGLTSVTCLAEKVPATGGSVFYNVPQSTATLYVPAASVDAYKAANQWKEFGQILPIKDGTAVINFADANVKQLCVSNWDTNGDGELNMAEAAAVTDLGIVFKNSKITSFDELQYFTRLTKIGDNAFWDCTGLTSVIIPESVTSIGEWAFFGCSGLTSINIPESVTSIGQYAFYSCFNLKSITIPNSVTSIGDYAFDNCSGLKSIIIPNSVTSIGDGAFYGCLGLTSITIPESVTSIGYYAFQGCKGITSINIPQSLTCIKSQTFSDCSSLTSVTIPNNVTSIGSSAFYGCSGLTSINIPESVTSIGQYVFDGCTSLPVIDNVRYADTYLVEAVDKTRRTYNIKEGTKIIGGHAFSGCSNLVSVNIPQNATTIGACAFENCTSLTSISIPESIKNIESKSFNNCSHLNRAEFANVERLCEVSFGDRDANPLSYARHLYIDGKEITDLIIPESVESIGAYAFCGCSNINSIMCLSSHVPQTSNNEKFDDIPGSVQLTIPIRLYTTYKNTLPWSKFIIKTIEGIIPPATYDYYLSDGTKMTSLDVGDLLLQKDETPNVIAVVDVDHAEWAKTQVCVLVEKNTGSIKTYSCPNFVLTDLTSGYSKDAADAARTSFYAPVSFTVDKGSYSRKATDGFNSVCLPFSFAASDLSATAKVYVFDSFDSSNNNVLLREVSGNVSAGTPCFVRETADVTWNVNLAGKTITANKPTVSGHTRGTYVTTDQYQGVGYSPRKSDNVFAPLALYLHPFRACFARNDLGLKGSSITISLIDKFGNIENLMDRLVESNNVSANVIYTLGGQRINEVKRSGVYIINGKKTYVEVK